jgi:hypothetical protein
MPHFGLDQGTSATCVILFVRAILLRDWLIFIFLPLRISKLEEGARQQLLC